MQKFWIFQSGHGLARCSVKYTAGVQLCGLNWNIFNHCMYSSIIFNNLFHPDIIRCLISLSLIMVLDKARQLLYRHKDEKGSNSVIGRWQ